MHSAFASQRMYVIGHHTFNLTPPPRLVLFKVRMHSAHVSYKISGNPLLCKIHRNLHLYQNLHDFRFDLIARSTTHQRTMNGQSPQAHLGAITSDDASTVATSNQTPSVASTPIISQTQLDEASQAKVAAPSTDQHHTCETSSRTASETTEQQAALGLAPIQSPELTSMSRQQWLSPHVMEHQKRDWYNTSLGMGEKHVQDAWGFSSASVSRSHSPSVGNGA
jgi:hypothetical protein